MKWNVEDIDTYEKAKEYIDTIVMPLYPISFDDKIKQSAGMTEFISILSVQLERQFRGRLLMLPGYTYLKSTNEDELYSDLINWEQEFLSKGFKYVYYLTSDSSWKGVETKLSGSLIWLPTVPLQQMDEQSRNSVLEDQVKQILEIFTQKWKFEQ